MIYITDFVSWKVETNVEKTGLLFNCSDTE